MTALQAQTEARRFATTDVGTHGEHAVKEAIRALVRGDRAAALAVMYAGLAAQAPLTFRVPGVGV